MDRAPPRLGRRHRLAFTRGAIGESRLADPNFPQRGSGQRRGGSSPAWKDELGNLVARSRVSDDFIRRINQILAEDAFYEILHRSGKTGFQLDPSASRLRVEKLALATLSRQIAHFLAEVNFGYLHCCANTTSCALYFYDTTKNHRRQWCSTAGCGNKYKVAAFRRRQAKHTT